VTASDVMRDVLRLVDVDPLQNCNGHFTIASAQADDLLKCVVRHGDQSRSASAYPTWEATGRICMHLKDSDSESS
jgi:hypothetical protein